MNCKKINKCMGNQQCNNSRTFHTFLGSVRTLPMRHANLVALSFIEPELLPVEVLSDLSWILSTIHCNQCPHFCSRLVGNCSASENLHDTRTIMCDVYPQTYKVLAQNTATILIKLIECLFACSCPSISTTTMHRRIRKVCCEHAYGFEVQSLICRYGHILGTWERLRLHWHVGFGVDGHDDSLQLDLWTAVGCRGQPRIPLSI